MSAPLDHDAVLFRQRLLAVAGLYRGKLDGDPGPKTDAAERAWEDAYHAAAKGYPQLDPPSEHRLWTVLPKAQALFRHLLGALDDDGLDARIVSGTRTYPEQAALFAQGPEVTRARAGESWHNFGLAIDIGIFEKGRYLRGATRDEVAAYDRAGAIGRAIAGIEWGGDWPHADRPHYQLATGLDRHELRRRFEAGEAYWS